MWVLQHPCAMRELRKLDLEKKDRQRRHGRRSRGECSWYKCHYAEAMLLAPTTWLGSYFLWWDEETELVALPRTYRKSTDMNSTARSEEASRYWMGVSQVHLFWKDWRCLSGLVLLFSVCEYSIDNGVRVRKWPNGISVVPTRCCTSRRVYCIAFSMFSPTRISVRSCSHGFSMCEIRSQELADSPPKMCVIGA